LTSSQQPVPDNVFIERPVSGQPHKGKVLLAVQAHSDDIPLSASGTVAKLIDEGYTGYLVRATNDDMGDQAGYGTVGTVGDHVLNNERDNEAIARAMGCEKVFDLNYGNHRMADVPLNELIMRLILIIRIVKADTVVCWDPWAHDEENPDHYMIARGIEAACWMAGRAHDYPEQFAAGLEPYEVKEKYYFARRPEITRVVDISRQVEKKIEANLANVAKGPYGHVGSRLRADLAKQGKKLPLLGDGDDESADRAYIREFGLARSREMGKRFGLEYAEAFHYIGPRPSRVDEYVKRNAVSTD
jgi:LmbE family N-acetylglucosaminyl deacetylase